MATSAAPRARSKPLTRRLHRIGSAVGLPPLTRPEAGAADRESASVNRGYARLRAVATGVALAALLVVLAEVLVDAVPDTAMLWFVTPLRLVLAVRLGALAVEALARRRAAHTEHGTARTPLPLPPLGLGTALFALVVVSAAVSYGLGAGWPEWRGLLTAAAAGVLAWGLCRLSPSHTEAVFAAALLALVTTAAVGISQSVNGTPTGFCRASLFGELDACVPGAMVRANGTFANPNLLAAVVLLLLPLALTAASRLTATGWRFATPVVAVLGVGAMLATASRGGLAALAVTGVAWLMLRRPNRLAVAAAAWAGGTLLAAVALYVAMGGSAGPRGDAWRAAGRLVSENPLGVGLGASGSRIAQIADGPTFQHAHNLWLAWFVDTGLLGGLAVIAVSLAAASLVVKAAFRACPAAPPLGAALAGFAAFSMVDHPSNAVRIALLMAVVIGVAAAHSRCHADDHTEVS